MTLRRSKGKWPLFLEWIRCMKSWAMDMNDALQLSKQRCIFSRWDKTWPTSWCNGLVLFLSFPLCRGEECRSRVTRSIFKSVWEHKMGYYQKVVVVVVLLLLLGVETWVKNVPNRTKIVQENKKCASVAHYGLELPCFSCMALCGLVCPIVVSYGLDVAFPVMTMCGLIRISMALCVLVWPCIRH